MSAINPPTTGTATDAGRLADEFDEAALVTHVAAASGGRETTGADDLSGMNESADAGDAEGYGDDGDAGYDDGEAGGYGDAGSGGLDEPIGAGAADAAGLGAGEPGGSEPDESEHSTSEHSTSENSTSEPGGVDRPGPAPDADGVGAGGVAQAIDAPGTGTDSAGANPAGSGSDSALAAAATFGSDVDDDAARTTGVAGVSEVDSAPAAVLDAPSGPAAGSDVDTGGAVEHPAGEVTRPVPALGPVPRPKQPASDERVLASGLRVIAIRRPGVPLVEVRLRVPFGGTVRTLPARSTVLGETMLSGTERRSQVELAAAVQALGADLHVSVDSDRLLLGGAVLRGGLPQLLELLAEVLTAASYPNREVAGERSRLIERLSIARSQPSVLVREALRRRMFGDHPYARELPSVAEVAAVTPPQVRRLHAERVTPGGAVLVAVGDVTPARALDQIEAALTDWRAGLPTRGLPALPPIEPGPTLVVDRPGSVQSSIRLAGPALPRNHEDYPALQLANLVFGGYFSSRLVENIREDKGYTYGPHSRIDHGSAGSTLVVDADVSTDVTAPALLETRYELGRMATLPVREAELDDVRQYAVGTLALSLASQSGLASTLAALAGSDLGLTWLREHPGRLAQVTLADVQRVSRQHLSPAGLVTVVLGDAATITEPLATLGPVQAAPAEEAGRS